MAFIRQPFVTTADQPASGRKGFKRWRKVSIDVFNSMQTKNFKWKYFIWLQITSVPSSFANRCTLCAKTYLRKTYWSILLETPSLPNTIYINCQSLLIWNMSGTGLSVFNHCHWFNNCGFNESSSTTSKIIVIAIIIIIFKLPSVKASHHRLQEIIRAERQRGQNNLNQSTDFCQSWWYRWWWWRWWWCSLM